MLEVILGYFTGIFGAIKDIFTKLLDLFKTEDDGATTTEAEVQ